MRMPQPNASRVVSAPKTMGKSPSTNKKSSGSTTGLVSLISMSLVTGDDTSQLFGSSPSCHQQFHLLDGLDDLLSNDFSDSFRSSVPECSSTDTTTPIALAVESRTAIDGSFDFLMALEPTPLGPKGAEASTTLVTTPHLQSTSTAEGALERLLSQEFNLVARTAPMSVTPQCSSSPTKPKEATITTSKRGVQPEGEVTSSLTAPPKKKRCTTSSRNKKSSEEGPKFRDYQEQQWTAKYHELLEFKAAHGHCLVPHTFDENPALSRWVKRQRYQYKLFLKRDTQSTMTHGRVRMLEDIGFVWDSHAIAWEERVLELKEFQASFGHCNVPSHYGKSPALAVWVKRQRRQVKLFWKGERSAITQERFAALRDLGFTWELRRSKNTC